MNAEQETAMDVIAGAEPRRTSRRAQWIGGAAAVGIGITLGAAGIAAAADPTPSPAPSGGTTQQLAPPGAKLGGPGMHRGHGMRGGKLGPHAAVHGEFVVPDGTGWRTVAVQRGVVTAVSSTSLTVKSKDGYTKTYVLTPATMVNAGRDGIAMVKKDEQVAVVATVKGGTATATHVDDLTQLKEHRKQFGPPPGRGPAPGGTPASPSSYGGDAGAQPA